MLSRNSRIRRNFGWQRELRALRGALGINAKLAASGGAAGIKGSSWPQVVILEANGAPEFERSTGFQGRSGFQRSLGFQRSAWGREEHLESAGTEETSGVF